MGSVLRRAGLVIGVLLVGAQFVPVDRSNPPATGTLADVPAPVAQSLRRACWDCHSRETVWPWYSRIAPVSWLVGHDVAEGREHLDFSIWTTLRPPRQAKLLAKIAEDVEEGEMPPWAYTLVHPQARLDPGARAALVAWANGARAALTPGAPASR